VNFPAAVRSLYAGGAESIAMVLDRLRWLYQGERTDRERNEVAYEPRLFVLGPGSVVEQAPAEPSARAPKRRPMHRRIKRRVRRIRRRVMRRLRALRG